MNTHEDKTSDQKSRAVANQTPQTQNGSISTFEFVDNRPEMVAQRKLQEMANQHTLQRKPIVLKATSPTDPSSEKDAINRSNLKPFQLKHNETPPEKSSQTTQLKPFKPNHTGLPNQLKSGIENLSGYSMDDVKVHYNSDKPAQLNAHAYAQGTDIHVASGQEKHLPHEAWHVVQQKQGRVKPTMQMKGNVSINDDKGLEKEADVMGAKALETSNSEKKSIEFPTVQRKLDTNVENPIQLVTAELQQNRLTSIMKQRWNPAYQKMKSIVDASSFGGSNKHSVVLWAASEGSMNGLSQIYASTSLYVSKNNQYTGYTQGDYGNFDEVILPFNFSNTTNRAYRIVIVFNLTKNRNIEEIYATFLHEWHVHAVPWMATAAAGNNIGGTNSAREDDDHKTYANKTDTELETYVGTLRLTSTAEKTAVLSKLKADRDRYSKTTGKIK